MRTSPMHGERVFAARAAGGVTNNRLFAKQSNTHPNVVS